MTCTASTHRFVWTWPATAVAVLALGGLASPGLSRDYNVTHNFTFTPGGNIMPTVWAIHYQHAMVKEWRPYCREFDVNPPASAQPTGWKSGRKDRLGANGLVFNGKEGHWVQATTALVVIPPTGFGPVTYTVSANSNCNPTAQATS